MTTGPEQVEELDEAGGAVTPKFVAPAVPANASSPRTAAATAINRLVI
jgi:hypothetical protein